METLDLTSVKAGTFGQVTPARILALVPPVFVITLPEDYEAQHLTSYPGSVAG